MKALTFLLLPAVCLVAGAVDPPAPDKEKEKEKEKPLGPLREQYQLAAKKYEFFLDKDKKKPLTLEPKPVFSWANDDDWSGDVFVWTAGGKPRVIGCTLSGPGKEDRPAFHEFHTLSPDPLGPVAMTAKYTWTPPGIGFHKQDGAPAATPAGRLPQMRGIARDLSAWMEADGKWELRLLPQPLMRYQPAEGDVIDGALFCWVWTKGTDPEVIVAVECHRTADKKLEWRIAPVRFSNRELWLKNGDRELWRVPVHRDEQGDTWSNVYTTRYAGRIALPQPKKNP
ncbi:unnamed protein product [Gemmata massiliana]|uniref:Uncharacterized protein n=1 Tax=Gemmata massiliana TaxID=1210884 RepID=A0A6P2D5K6_9BACT|nr:hypothetical protein [Gemmata massiliana]VTR96177.1 unnamed protein product [Gemmata massiliana]